MEEEKKEEAKKPIIEKLIDETEQALETMLEDGLQTSDVEMVCKLTKIYKEAKESENMNYGNYNGYNNYGNNYGNYGRNYGEYNDGSYGRENYGRRGVDSKYRGYGHLDRMYNEYGNYSYGRERYGANEDTKKSLEYMLRSMEDFARILKEDAQSQEEVMMIKQSAQRIAQM